MIRTPRRPLARLAVTVAAAGALLATGFIAHAAFAGPTQPLTPEAPVVSFTGKGVIATDVKTDPQLQSFNSTTWSGIANSSVSVTVPSGGWHLVSSTFSGETNCFGGASTWCAVRIIAIKSGTTTKVPLYPQSDTFYAVDSAGDDNWEGHSLDRSKTLAPGTWTIRAEAAVSTAGTTLNIEDWHHRVHLYGR